jgi:L-2,4-diaminobutyric acid acetyltransferase
MFSVKTNKSGQTAISLRRPRAADGPALHALVAACPPLDPNSRYCNLLHCTHFAGTSVAAERCSDGQSSLVGFISAYIPPERPDTLFVWQVAVHADARGAGLGRRMLRHLLQRPACAAVRYLDTTVTGDNAASAAMFRGLADTLLRPNGEKGVRVRRHRWFDRERHFGGVHDSEYLLRIGPFHMHTAAHRRSAADLDAAAHASSAVESPHSAVVPPSRLRRA